MPRSFRLCLSHTSLQYSSGFLSASGCSLLLAPHIISRLTLLKYDSDHVISCSLDIHRLSKTGCSVIACLINDFFSAQILIQKLETLQCTDCFSSRSFFSFSLHILSLSLWTPFFNSQLKPFIPVSLPCFIGTLVAVIVLPLSWYKPPCLKKHTNKQKANKQQ